MNEVFLHLQREGIIPVVTISSRGDSPFIVDALVKGGIFTIEITLRTDEGVKAIALIKDRFPEVLVGAGTVTTRKRFDEAFEAGADFFVTPGMNQEIILQALAVNKPIIPGCLTPTELDAGISHGLEVFKYFPSESFGGLKTIKALSGPYPDVLFIPTGGINLENARQYLSNSRILAVGGSWLVKEGWVRDGQFEEITKCANEARKMVTEVRPEAVQHA
jgi:2-dehydro-3-deoxyphosphogluconate aldolase/(4S)-4-hydroxy-2-oxoglutarate aldolase